MRSWRSTPDRDKIGKDECTRRYINNRNENIEVDEGCDTSEQREKVTKLGDL